MRRFQSIKAKLIVALIIILGMSIFVSTLNLRRAWGEYTDAQYYELINSIAGDLNEAAGHQALERGFGVTILASENTDEEVLNKFNQSASQGQGRMEKAVASLDILLGMSENMDLKLAAERWRKNRNELLAAREKVEFRQIEPEEWLKLSTDNIEMEFFVRDLALAPINEKERLTYYNTIIRSNAATLAEFAGRERAGLLEAVEKGAPISDLRLTQLEKTNSVVDEASKRIMSIKDYSSTPAQLKNMINLYEKEFLGEYRQLRDDVYRKSKERRSKVGQIKSMIDGEKARLESHMKAKVDELWNLANSSNVMKLAGALVEDRQGLLRLKLSVENDYFALSQSSQDYMIIRFIDPLGKELVRVDYDGATFSRRRGARLADKVEDEVMDRARNLGPGEMYISRVSLNMVEGKLETPYRPVMSLVAPVYANNTLSGYVLARIIVGRALENIRQKDRQVKAFLVDGDGYYLHHSDNDKAWGFVGGLGRQQNNILLDLPDMAEDVLSRDTGMAVTKNGNTYLWTPVFYNPENRREYWVLMRSIGPVDYGMTGTKWMEKATRAINTVLMMSGIVGDQAKIVVEKIEEDSTYSIFLNGFIALLSFAVVVLTIMIVIAAINPLYDAVQRLKDISEGEGDLTQRMEVKTKDEVGDLAFWFNRLMEKMQKVLVEISYSSKTLASSSEEMSGVSLQLASGSEEMTNKATVVAGATEQMSSSISAMALAVEEMSLNVSMVSNGAEDVSKSMVSVSATMDDMSTSIHNITEGARKALTVTGAAKERSAAASRAMNSLDAAAGEIGKVTGVIKRIAEQTNLLALNATIEAASAGAAGKGFAVVANEIKQLANQSASAAEDIAKRIEGVQDNTERAVEVLGEMFSIMNSIGKSVEDVTGMMERQSKTAREISETVNQAAEGASSIALSISQVAKGSSEMSSNVGQAARGALDVSTNIQVVSDNATDTTNSAQLVNQSSLSLARIAGELDMMVSKFKVA
ncbi:MAG: methyl-accepting chemotaxis protein [Nitrospinota bacterium]|nr:methyl-accepting chemotaxis protein [Nitrospinota bacterium]